MIQEEKVKLEKLGKESFEKSEQLRAIYKRRIEMEQESENLKNQAILLSDRINEIYHKVAKILKIKKPNIKQKTL